VETTTVLLVEDNEVNQEVAAAMLRRRGYRVDVVENGQDAVDAVARKPYDAVLMDCQMPVMDGYAATEELRRREVDVPIIALTAHGLDGERERCLAAGMDDFLAKPVLLDDLRGAFQRSRCEEGAGASEKDELKDATPPLRPTELPVLDPGRIASLRRLGELTGQPLVRDVVDGFLKETPGRLDRMRGALVRGDAEELAFIAHSLKGSSGQLGALRVAALSGELEGRGKNEDLDGASGLLAEIERETARVAHLLEQER